MANYNHRRVKIHLSYTVEEVARLFAIHRNTVRQWIKAGLPTCDDKRPTLILGRHLVTFLQERRKKSRRGCAPGELYCFRCRLPRSPAGDMIDYIAQTAALGNLVGLCPVCETWMYRRVNPRKLHQVLAGLSVRLREGLRNLGESSQASVNSDFGSGSGR
jgi:hypothetical protein